MLLVISLTAAPPGMVVWCLPFVVTIIPQDYDLTDVAHNSLN